MTQAVQGDGHHPASVVPTTASSDSKNKASTMASPISSPPRDDEMTPANLRKRLRAAERLNHKLARENSDFRARINSTSPRKAFPSPARGNGNADNSSLSTPMTSDQALELAACFAVNREALAMLNSQVLKLREVVSVVVPDDNDVSYSIDTCAEALTKALPEEKDGDPRAASDEGPKGGNNEGKVVSVAQQLKSLESLVASKFDFLDALESRTKPGGAGPFTPASPSKLNLEERMAMLASENNELKARVKAHASEIDTLVREKINLMEKAEEGALAKEQLDAMDQAVSDLGSADSISAACGGEACSKVVDAVKRLSAENTDLSTKLAAQTSKVDSLIEEKFQLRDETAVRSMQLGTLSEEKNGLVEGLKDAIDRLTNEKSQMVSTLTKQKDELNAKFEHIERLMKENEELKLRVQSLGGGVPLVPSQEHEKVKDELATTRAEFDGLKATHESLLSAQADSSNSVLVAALQTANVEKATLSAGLMDKDFIIMELEEKLKAHQLTLEKVMARNNHLETLSSGGQGEPSAPSVGVEASPATRNALEVSKAIMGEDQSENIRHMQAQARTIEQLIDEKAELEVKLEAQMRANSHMKDERDVLNETIQHLEMGNGGQSSSGPSQGEAADGDKNDVSDLRDRLVRSRAEKNVLTKELKMLEKQLTDAKVNNQNLEHQLKGLQATIDNLDFSPKPQISESELDQLKSQVSSLSQAKEDAEAKLLEAAKDKAQVVSAIEEEANSLRSKIVELEGKVSAAEAKSSTLEKQVSESTQKGSEEASRASAVKEELDALKGEQSKLQEQLAVALAKHTELDAALASSKEESGAIVAEKDNALRQLAAVQESLAACEARIKSEAEAAQSSSTALADKVKEIEKVSEELAVSKGEVNRLTASLSETEKLRSQDEETVKGLEATVADLEKLTATTSSEKKQLEVDLNNVKESLQSSKDELAEAKSVSENLQSELNAVKAEKQQIEESLSVEKSAKESLASELGTLEGQMDAAKTELETAKAEATKAGEEKTQAESMLRDAEGKLAEKDGELARERAAVEEVKSKMEEQTSLVSKLKETNSDLRHLSQVCSSSFSRCNLPSLFKETSRDVKALADEANGIVGQLGTAFAQATQAWDKEVKSASKEVEGYKQKWAKESALRKKLHNRVMELQGNIRVFCRVRPQLPGETNAEGVVEFPGENELKVTRFGATAVAAGKDGPRMKESKDFEFDRVYNQDATQEQVFQDTMPLITSVMDGYNVCIFAYGQTASGKTYTMEGPSENRGVNFRALGQLFNIADERSADYDYVFKVGMVEIYNEQLQDLLEKPVNGAKKKLDIRQGLQGIHVPDMRVEEVKTLEDVENWMKLGSKHRAVGAHNVNEHSSRSHMVLSVYVTGTNKTTGVVWNGKLHLCDLAGSERISKTEAQGDRLLEAQAINKSLSALGDVIQALVSKSNHVPFRNSKLTYLLSDSLSGDSKTMMFVQVSPAVENVGESLCSLNFASRVRNVELGQATRHSSISGPSGSSKKT